MRAIEVIFGLDSVWIEQTSRESMWLGTEEEEKREEKRGLNFEVRSQSRTKDKENVLGERNI